MNKCYFMGKIIEMSDYKFFYNSKKHNSIISLKILTLDSNIRNRTTIDINIYDGVADYVYRKCNIGDIICTEGKIGTNMNIEILKIELMT